MKFKDFALLMLLWAIFIYNPTEKFSFTNLATQLGFARDIRGVEAIMDIPSEKAE